MAYWHYDDFDEFDPDDHEVQVDDSVPEDDGEATENKSSVEFGPHPKFTRGYEQYALEKEMKMVNEKRVIFSMDLFVGYLHKMLSDPGLQ